MPDVQMVTQLISSVGFPIVACIGLFYLFHTTIQDLKITLATMEVTLNSIKDAMESLCTRISALEDKE